MSDQNDSDTGPGTGRDAISVRRAAAGDVEAACDVWIRSIRQVCGPDYGNDETILGPWCSNKRPEIMRKWMADPTIRLFVAERDGRILGVSMVAVSTAGGGEVQACYVAPEALRQGIGAALLRLVEAAARECGLTELTLHSTITARSFYLRHGYAMAAEPVLVRGILAFPMRKPLIQQKD